MHLFRPLHPGRLGIIHVFQSLPSHRAEFTEKQSTKWQCPFGKQCWGDWLHFDHRYQNEEHAVLLSSARTLLKGREFKRGLPLLKGSIDSLHWRLNGNFEKVYVPEFLSKNVSLYYEQWSNSTDQFDSCCDTIKYMFSKTLFLLGVSYKRVAIIVIVGVYENIFSAK